MADERPGRPRSGNGLADADGDVAREYEALSHLLIGLAQRSDEPALPQIADAAESAQVSRWIVVLHAVDRLAEVAAIREELLKIPYFIAVRVTDVTGEEIRAILTATSSLEEPELLEMLVEALQVVGSVGMVYSVAKYRSPGG